ncbi:barstar family protein [Yinghuangia soli]|uniref:Barstar family protein n=1 Tax=Yinghuangia soli TaxID=2908204 RepID=A0AA41PXP4_9ACTN|nr:barstar family protein [Yinghuangia soli]MCF2527121.1 barstar family protein [Yinghuangia soli]
MTPFSFTTMSPPWVVFAPEGDPRVRGEIDALTAAGGRVTVLAARDLATPRQVFDTFAAALAFPGYFGRNWDALVDCLSNLHGQVRQRDMAVVVEAAESLLDADFLALFVSVLGQAAERAVFRVDAEGLPHALPLYAQHFVFEFAPDAAAASDFAAVLRSRPELVAEERDGLVLVRLAPR